MIDLTLKTCAFLVLAIIAGCSAQQNEIRLGFIGPLSGNGAIYGMTEQRAGIIALAEMNNTIAGRPVRVIYEDGRCTAEGGFAAATKLIEIDEVHIILSLCSSETLAIAPLAESHHVLLITSWGTNPSISTAGDYVFRNSYSDIDTGNTMARTVRARHSSVGVISEQSSYAMGLRDVFIAEFTRLNGTVTNEEFPQDDTDTRTQAIKIIERHPESIFMIPETDATASNLIQTVRELGFDGQIYGNFIFASSTLSSMPEAEGIIFYTDPVVPDNAHYQRLVKTYQRQYHEPPVFEYPLASRYDTLHVLAHAIETVGDNPESLKEYLYHMPTYEGILGNITYDSQGDLRRGVPSIQQIVNGTPIVLEPLVQPLP